jgi:hypothetical protein
MKGFQFYGIHYCELELSFAIHPNSHPNHWGLTLNWGLLNWGLTPIYLSFKQFSTIIP